MTSRTNNELLLATAVAWLLLTGVFKAGAQAVATSSGFVQETRKLEFEVASIKTAAVQDFAAAGRSGTEIRVGARVYGDRVEYRSMTLYQLIAEAYLVRTLQIVASPGQLPRERFDIVCKMPAGSRKEDAPLMLQSLLADRFKLAVHRESKETDVWALVVGKGGPKFKESPSEGPLNPSDGKGESPEGAAPPILKTKDGNHVITGTYGRTFSRMTLDYASASTRYEASRMTMPYLADLVSRTTFANDLPVVDMTGLKGEYDVVYDFPFSALGSAAGAPSASAQSPRPAEAASDPGGVGVLRAMRSLGLDLEKRKVQLEQLVVDHVDKAPTEN